MKGLLYNPLFNAGMGLLAAGGPSKMPVSLGQAMSRGLLQAQNANIAGSELQDREQQNALRAQQIQLQTEAARQEQEQRAQQQAAMQQLRGLLSPEQAALVDAGVPVDKVAQAAGLLGADPAQQTNLMTEYAAAQAQGYQGSLIDFKRMWADAGRPVTNISTPVSVYGGAYAPTTTQGKQVFDLEQMRQLREQYPAGSPERANVDRGIAALQAELQPAVSDTGKELQGAQDRLQRLDEIAEHFKSEGMTRQGRWRVGVARQLDLLGKASPEDRSLLNQWTTFENLVETEFNQYRKDVTGAAASVPELEMLKNAMMNTDQSPAQFAASYNLYRSALERFITTRQQLMSQGANMQPPTTGTRLPVGGAQTVPLSSPMPLSPIDLTGLQQ